MITIVYSEPDVNGVTLFSIYTQWMYIVYATLRVIFHTSVEFKVEH